MDILCLAGVHSFERTKVTKKCFYYVCSLCGEKKRNYRPGCKPLGVHRRFRNGRWYSSRAR